MSLDDEDFCQSVFNVHSADIIVTVDGSQNQLLSYARPGSVVIFVFPYHFRLPDWKVLAYFAGLRSLEIVTLNASLATDVSSPVVLEYYNQPISACYQWLCRNLIKSIGVSVPLETFDLFLQHAVRIWNVPKVESCEVPLPWPVKFEVGQEIPKGNDFWLYSAYGYPNNWEVCEPPFPNCTCCKSKECASATRTLDRGF